MINIIKFTLGTTNTYYVKDKITLELLQKFIDIVCHGLSVRIHRDHHEEWLEVEGQIIASHPDGWGVYSSNEDMLSWESVEEIEL